MLPAYQDFSLEPRKDEQWTDLSIFNGCFLNRYRISTHGRFLCLPNCSRNYPFIMHQAINKDGYLRIGLVSVSDGVKRRTLYLTHRLVAHQFIPIPQELISYYDELNKQRELKNLPLLQIPINHKDEIKTNNYVSNLEWVTHSYNIHYGTRNLRARLTHLKNPKVIPHNGVLQVETGRVFSSVYEIHRLGIADKSNVWKCCKGLLKHTGGYSWRFL